MRSQIFWQQLQNDLLQTLQFLDAFEYGQRGSCKDSGTGYSIFSWHLINNKQIGNYIK